MTVIEGPEGGLTCRAQLVKYDMSVLNISRTHASRGAASALFFPVGPSPGPTAYVLRLRALALGPCNVLRGGDRNEGLVSGRSLFPYR